MSEKDGTSKMEAPFDHDYLDSPGKTELPEDRAQSADELTEDGAQSTDDLTTDDGIPEDRAQSTEDPPEDKAQSADEIPEERAQSADELTADGTTSADELAEHKAQSADNLTEESVQSADDLSEEKAQSDDLPEDGAQSTDAGEMNPEMNDSNLEMEHECQAAVDAIEHDGSVFIEETDNDKEEAAALTDDGSSSASNAQREIKQNQVYNVDLIRSPKGFGFSIGGGRDFISTPIVVSHITENGVADMDGRLQTGDHLLEINRYTTENMSHSEAIDIIQKGGRTLRLRVRRIGKPPPNVGVSGPSHGKQTGRKKSARIAGRKGPIKECTTKINQLLEVFPFVCGLCYLQFNKLNLYFEHLASHSESKDDVYHICADGHSKNDDGTAKVLTCGICEGVFPTICLLHEHMLRKENVDKYVFDKSTNTSTGLRPISNPYIRNSTTEKRTEVRSIIIPKSTGQDLDNQKTLNVTMFNNGSIQHIKVNPLSKPSLNTSPKKTTKGGKRKKVLSASEGANKEGDSGDTSMELDNDTTETAVKLEEVNNSVTETQSSLKSFPKQAKGVSRKKRWKVLPASAYGYVESGKTSLLETANEGDEDGDASMEVTDDRAEIVVKVEQEIDQSTDDQLDNKIEKKKPMQPKKKTSVKKASTQGRSKNVDIDSQTATKFNEEDPTTWTDSIFVSSQEFLDETERKAKQSKSSTKSEIPWLKQQAPCQYCGKMVRKVRMATHEKIHTRPAMQKQEPRKNTWNRSGAKVPCQFCGRTCIKANLKRHEETHCEQSKVECQICGVKVGKSGLKQHETVKHSGKPLKTIQQVPCQYCSKMVSKHNLKKHEELHTNGRSQKYGNLTSQEIDELWIPCKVCGRICSQANLKRHEETHSGELNVECQICGVQVGKSGLKQHLTVKHSDKPLKTIPRVPCQYCSKMVSKHNLKKHEELHTNGRSQKYGNLTSQEIDELWIPCKVCGRKMKRGNLKRHEDSHYSTQRHPCSKCGKVFPTRAKLNSHMAAHSTIAPHVCDICGKAFKWKGCLKVHMGIHVEGKHLQCPVCPLKFKTQGCLYGHMKKHSEKRTYVCDTCGQSFYRCDMLVRHKLKHTNVRPFTCGTCHRSFKDKHQLKRHTKIHQPPRHFCPFCNKTFVNVHNMKAHMRTHLNGAELDADAVATIIVQPDTATLVDATGLETIEYSL